MNKERIKGIVVGFLLCALLSTSVMVMATPRTETRQITYGVRVNFNGQLVQFDADSQPFVMGGRTFLPLRAVADLLDLPVNFDPNTNTAYLGSWTPTAPTSQPTPVPTPAPTPAPVTVRQYLESDIFSVSLPANWNRHPENGAIDMYGVIFHRGISTTERGYGYAIYDISGRGFTRLKGNFGITALGRGGVASITVTDADSGRFLGGVSEPVAPWHVPVLLDVLIPLETQRISIWIDTPSSRVGLGDAFFE